LLTCYEGGVRHLRHSPDRARFRPYVVGGKGSALRPVASPKGEAIAEVDPGPSEVELLARADAALARGRHDEALRLWSDVRAQCPDASQAWLRAGELLNELRRFDEAEILLDEAVGRFPDNFWVWRVRALVMKGLGDDVEAYTRARALRLAFPSNAAAHAGYVHLLLDLDHLPAAEAEAKASMTLFPDHPWLGHMYAQCADMAGNASEAAARWTDLLMRHPDHSAGYDPAARALVAVGRHDEAAGLAREGLRLSAKSLRRAEATAERPSGKGGASPVKPAPDLLASALRAERAGQWSEAERLWTQLRGREPTLALAYAGGARALLQLNRIAEAEMILAKARRDLPPDAGVLQAWAEAALVRGAFEIALTRFRTFRQAFDTRRAVLGVAEALRRLGRLDEADAVYGELNQGRASDLALAQQYALLAETRGDGPEAIRRWTRVTTSFPDHMRGYWHLADALRRAERWAEADVVLSQMIARFPDDPETALQWAKSGRQGSLRDAGSARWDELCRRFPDIAPMVRPKRSSAR
jgi:tetratricopeptide (TPR) repeat protein